MTVAPGSLQDNIRNATRPTAPSPETAIAVVNPDGTNISSSGSSSNATVPTITNYSVPTANTEVSHILQTNLKKITIRSRNSAKMQFAFVATESSTKYITVLPGVTYTEENLNLSGLTLYFQLNSAPGIVEILEWN